MIVYLPPVALNITLPMVFPVVSLHDRLMLVIVSKSSLLSYDNTNSIESGLPVVGTPGTTLPVGGSVMEQNYDIRHLQALHPCVLFYFSNPGPSKIINGTMIGYSQ